MIVTNIGYQNPDILYFYGYVNGKTSQLKKWNGMEKRIADLEKRVQAQPKEIIEEFSKQLNSQMSKHSVRPQNPWI